MIAPSEHQSRSTPSRTSAPQYTDYPSVQPHFLALASLPAGDPARRPVRDLLITVHLPLARNVARRFVHRGEPLEDLTQVATVGLLRAIDRFDPYRGVEFLAFAIPTVMGEVRRHFRDHGWSVHVPRRLQEMHLRINAATSDLTQQLGRAPTPRELAAHLDWPDEAVVDALQASPAYRSSSLDAPAIPGSDAPPLGETLGAVQAALEGVDNIESLRPLLASLSPRDRRVLSLRFSGELTQSQIAEQIGVSQMQVSRMLGRTLGRLRAGLLAEG